MSVSKIWKGLFDYDMAAYQRTCGDLVVYSPEVGSVKIECYPGPQLMVICLAGSTPLWIIPDPDATLLLATIAQPDVNSSPRWMTIPKQIWMHGLEGRRWRFPNTLERQENNGGVL
ncbi:hypothetical protein K438DRAFT_1752006 [Mycena galopus ATCC 62051]|nr:hypothetical protein K438DRAFT_1752006 [Mycena galopus ATCC 62051]